MEKIPAIKLKSAFEDNEKMKTQKLESEKFIRDLCYKTLADCENWKDKNEKEFKTKFPTLEIEKDDKDLEFLNKLDGIAYREMQEDHRKLKEDIIRLNKEIVIIETNRERRNDLIKTNQEN
ncbi:MAG: hypothetical protein WAV23_00570 [Minisyncoccia bacterium]